MLRACKGNWTFELSRGGARAWLSFYLGAGLSWADFVENKLSLFRDVVLICGTIFGGTRGFCPIHIAPSPTQSNFILHYFLIFYLNFFCLTWCFKRFPFKKSFCNLLIIPISEEDADELAIRRTRLLEFLIPNTHAVFINSSNCNYCVTIFLQIIAMTRWSLWTFSQMASL